MAPVILRAGFENVKHLIHFTKNTLAKGEKLTFCHIKHVEEYVDDSINSGGFMILPPVGWNIFPPILRGGFKLFWALGKIFISGPNVKT